VLESGLGRYRSEPMARRKNALSAIVLFWFESGKDFCLDKLSRIHYTRQSGDILSNNVNKALLVVPGLR
jgi:hypothetical protein